MADMTLPLIVGINHAWRCCRTWTLGVFFRFCMLLCFLSTLCL